MSIQDLERSVTEAIHSKEKEVSKAVKRGSKLSKKRVSETEKIAVRKHIPLPSENITEGKIKRARA